jgi:hypothetical protein
MSAGWIYQIIKAFLDFFRETPPTDVQHGQAPKALKDDLAARVADLPGLPTDQGGPGAKR